MLINVTIPAQEVEQIVAEYIKASAPLKSYGLSNAELIHHLEQMAKDSCMGNAEILKNAADRIREQAEQLKERKGND